MPSKVFARYTIVFLAALVVTILFPLPMDEAKVLVRQAIQSGAPTILLGSSGIDESSACDSDRRSIVGLLADRMGEPVIDSSRNGMTTEQSVDVAALVVKYRNVKQVVLAAGWLDVLESDALSVHDYVAFRELNPELVMDGPLSFYHGLESLFSVHKNFDQPFVYNNVAYPGFVPNLFINEVKYRTCPENDGHDMDGIKATYYHNMIEYSPKGALSRLIVSLSSKLQAGHKSVLFTMLPIDMDYLARLDPSWPGIISKRRDEFLSQLRAGGVQVLDLSETLPNDEFIDRWCGCTHFSASGRATIAAKISGMLSSVKVAQDQG